MSWSKAMEKMEYPFTIRPLAAEEGGGYPLEFPDLPGCMSDADAPEKGIASGRDALRNYLLTAREFGDPIPKPRASASGQWPRRG